MPQEFTILHDHSNPLAMLKGYKDYETSFAINYMTSAFVYPEALLIHYMCIAFDMIDYMLRIIDT